MSEETQRPVRRLTRRMYETFALCERRYWIEYERDFRRDVQFDPWPPSKKSVLGMLLTRRDVHMSVGGDLARLPELFSSYLKSDLLPFWHQRTMEAGMDPNGFMDDLGRLAREYELNRILAHYCKTHSGDGPKLWLKGKTKRPIIDTMHESKPPIVCECSGAGCEKCNGTGFRRRSRWSYAAKLDGVVSIEGEPWVLVRKFTSTVDPEEMRKELDLRLDWIGHVWLASELIGQTVKGILFDIVRTKPPSLPATVKCTSCKGVGTVPVNKDGTEEVADCPECVGSGVGGMSKAGCDTTEELWLREAQLQLTPAQLQEVPTKHSELLDKLRERGESFAYRHPVPVSKFAVQEWLRDFYHTTRELDMAKRENRWPRNPASCLCKGSKCPYRRPCRNDEDEKEAWYSKKVEMYPGEEPGSL